MLMVIRCKSRETLEKEGTHDGGPPFSPLLATLHIVPFYTQAEAAEMLISYNNDSLI